MSFIRVDEEPWKWAPILLLSPMPWSLISLLVMGGGQIVLNIAETDCTDPSSNKVDTSLMVAGLGMGIVAAYLFLLVYAWVWLGHSIHLLMPCPTSLKPSEWKWVRRRVMSPITSLKFIVICYLFIGFVSTLAAILLSAGVGNAAYLCTSQTPLLVSFSSFTMILYWIAFGINVIRFGSMMYIQKEVTDEEKDSSQPDTDIDMVRTIFKSYDKTGNGEMESSDMGSLLENIGMECTEEEVQDIIYEMDNDNTGSITLYEFETWYMKESNEKKKRKKKKKEPVFEEEQGFDDINEDDLNDADVDDVGDDDE